VRERSFNIALTYVVDVALQMSGQRGTEAAFTSTWRPMEQVTSAIWNATIGEKSPPTLVSNHLKNSESREQ
jgi:hypothetical protein